MWEFFQSLFSPEGFVPRARCGDWDTGQVLLHVVSDAVIWGSYLWIPCVMLWSAWRRRTRLHLSRPLLWLLGLYAVFITACGWTHFMDALIFFNPLYRLSGVVLAVTAVASAATALSLVWLIPQAIDTPITLLAQKQALERERGWLRDILDTATEGRLIFCGERQALPPPLMSEGQRIVLSEASDLRTARDVTRGAAASLEIDPVRASDLMTAVHEAAMNSVVHSGHAALSLYTSGDRVQVWIEDAGPGIHLDRLPLATLKQGYSTAGTAGQGWYLILHCVDRAYLFTEPGETVVVLEMDKSMPERKIGELSLYHLMRAV